MGWLVGVGVEVVDESVNDAKHRVLHSACCIKVAPFKYAVLWAEHGVHCIGPHNSVEFGLIRIRNGDRSGTYNLVPGGRTTASRSHRPSLGSSISKLLRKISTSEKLSKLPWSNFLRPIITYFFPPLASR
jgi:hypothetical protein